MDELAKRAIEVLYGTGLRISELVGLSLGDLDLDAAVLRAFGKGARERVVPVGRPTVADDQQRPSDLLEARQQLRARVRGGEARDRGRRLHAARLVGHHEIGRAHV